MKANPVVSASIDINAPIDIVWSVMLDLRRYHEWNPFIVDVENAPDSPHAGSRFCLKVRWANGKTVRSWETLSQLSPPATTDDTRYSALLAYGYSSWLARTGIVIATRNQFLTQEQGQPTNYRTEESFHGLLARFVPLQNVQDGFQRHALALKQRAEALAAAAALVTNTV